MKYDLVFSKAWHIIWKNKALWLFGLLASCGRNAGGSSGSSSSQSSGSIFNHGVAASPSLNWPGSLNQWQLQLKHLSEAEPWLIILLILGLFLLVMFIIVASFFLGALGRVGVTRGAWIADQEDAEKLSIGRIFSESLPFVGRVLLLTIVVWVALMLLISIVALPIILLMVLSAGFLLFFLIPVLIPLSFFLLLFALVVFVLIEQSVVAIVIEDLGTFEAIQRAWNIFRNHPLPNLIVGAILMFGQGLVTAFIVLPFLLTFLPFLFSLLFDTKVALGIGAGLSGLAFLLYLPITMVLFGMLHAYIGSVWVFTFQQLSAREQTNHVN